MGNAAIAVFDAEQTARLLDFPSLVSRLSQATLDYAAGAIHAPERQAVPFPNGGVMLSMPATAADIGIHKLVNVIAANRDKGFPTINGIVSAYDGATGQTLFVMDGPTVTARRTAAISMLGLKTFLKTAPKRVGLIGTGTQSEGHVQALAALFPQIQIAITGSRREKAQAFCLKHQHLPVQWEACTRLPDDLDAVITLTTSQTPVYCAPAMA
ncbi:MAG TPA: delta(1)-pyrroline-2-carboxylate reductase family protein, partial [Eoetvoesiella sp.]